MRKEAKRKEHESWGSWYQANAMQSNILKQSICIHRLSAYRNVVLQVRVIDKDGQHGQLPLLSISHGIVSCFIKYVYIYCLWLHLH